VKPWVRYVKPVGVTGVVVLLIVEILQDALRQSVPGSKRSIFSTVYSVLLLVSVIAVCAGFLLYGRRLYASLSIFKNESANSKYMRRLQSITNAVSIVAVVIAIVIAIASFARIWFRTYQTWLAYAIYHIFLILITV
jgi:L-asparagine transporter-like permease